MFIMSGAENNSILCRDCNESNIFYQSYPCLKPGADSIIKFHDDIKISLSVPLVLSLPTKFKNKCTINKISWPTRISYGVKKVSIISNKNAYWNILLLTGTDSVHSLGAFLAHYWHYNTVQTWSS
mgnify:CR=1 FL=1